MTHLSKIIRIHTFAPIWYGLFLSLLFYSAFFLFGTPIYEINDDVFLTLIASGRYHGTPSPYLFSIDVVTGTFLSTLYSAMPSINWYSYSLYFYLFLSLWTLLYITRREVKNNIGAVMSFIFILLCYARTMFFLSFTIVGALVGISGILLIIIPLKNDSKLTKKRILVGLILIILSNFIRLGSLGLSIVPALVLIGYKLLAQKHLRRFLIVSILATTLLLGLARYNHTRTFSPNDPRWKDGAELLPISWCAYSPTACSYDIQKQAYDAGHWSRNDYYMYLLHFYEDKQIFSKINTEIITRNINKYNALIAMLKLTPIHASYKLATHFEYIMMIMVCGWILWKTIDERHKKILLISISYCTLIIFYFIFRGYLPDRAMFPIVFYIGLTIFLNSNIHSQFNLTGSNNRTAMLYCFYASLVVVMTFKVITANQTNKEKIAHFKNIYSKIPSGNNLTFIWASTIPYDWQNPLKNLEDMEGKHILIGAWTLRTPYNESIKKQFKVTDLYTDLYKKQNLYLVAAPSQEELLKTYMEEHYGVTVTFDRIHSFERDKFSSSLIKVNQLNKDDRN